MKKFIYFLLINLFCIPLFAQFDVVGSNEFGRIFGVTYDKTMQNKLYAITLGNHILTSDDNGQSWTIFYSEQNGSFGKLDNNLQAYHNDKLTYFLQNANSSAAGRTVYLLDIATQTIAHEYTTPIPDPSSEGNWVTSYSISESDSDYALISVGYKIGLANYEKVFYTTDAGENWEEVYYTADNLNIFPGEVAIHPENPEKLYITRGNGDTDTDGGLLISEDGGQTWTEKIPGIVLQPITFNPENSDEIWIGTGISFGEYPENLYKSTDGGDTWNIVPIAWTDYLLDCINVIQFNPSDPSNMIILEDNEVAISNDGGATWDLHVYPDALDNPEEYSYGLDASFNPFAENEIFVSANYYPMFSTDKGATMVRVKTPYFASDGQVNYFNDGEEEHLYYGVQFGFAHKNILTNEEGAYNIMPLNFVTNNSGTTLFIDRNLPGRVFTFSGGFMGSNLNVSSDHGENQHLIYSNFSSNLHEVAVLPDNSNKIWASFSSFGDNPEIYEIDFSDLENVQANPVNLPSSSGVIMGILFDPENSQNATVAKGSRVHKSTDGGASWTVSSNGLEVLNIDSDMIFKLVRNPLNPDQISIATNKGVFTSTDNGSSWSQLSNSFVHNMKHSTVVDGQIIAATHDSDLSEFKLTYSKDGGVTWTDIADDEVMFLNSSSVFSSTDFNFYDNFVDVFVGTSGLGVIKFTIDLTTLKVIDSDLLSKNSAVIYPNPANDFVNIESKEGVRSAEIYSLAGQKILSSNSPKIDVSHLNTGIYLMKILLENGKTETQKLIKK